MRQHNWNSRRCIRMARYTSIARAMETLQFLRNTHRLQDPSVQVVHCPHCNGEHLVGSSRGMSAEQVLEWKLLPIEHHAADPSRSNGSYARGT